MPVGPEDRPREQLGRDLPLLVLSELPTETTTVLTLRPHGDS